MDVTRQLLLVEDNPGDALLVREQLAAVGSPWRPTHVSTLSGALEALESERFAASLLDPDSRGLGGMRQLADRHPSLPVVVLTGHSHELLGLDAIRAGAEDYLVKGRSDGAEIDRSLRFAVERRRSIVALRREHDILDRLLDASPALVVELGPDGVISHFNPATEQLTGRSASEVVGRSWFDLFATPDRHPEAHTVFSRALGGAPSGAAEAPLVGRDGSVHPVAWSWSRTESDSSLVAFGIDLRERREIEERLRVSADQALLGRVVAGVAHEVRNPLFALTAILDSVELSEPSGAWRRAIDDLRPPAASLAGLSDELNGFAELYPAGEGPVPARDRVEAGLDACRREAEQRRVALEMRVDGDCPPISPETRLDRVITSLVSHVLRSSPEEAVVHVSASPARDEGEPGLDCQVATGPLDIDGGLGPLSPDDARGMGISVALVRRHLATLARPLQARTGSRPAFRFWLPAAAPKAS